MEKERPRRTKDKIKNDEGKKMLEMVEENGWSILNGNTEDDEDQVWKYINKERKKREGMTKKIEIRE